MRIESSMAFVFGVRMRAFVGSALLCPILLCQVSLGVTGSFRGRVIDGPEGKKASGWLYLESRNHMVRKVEISRAKVTYAESVPREQQAEPAHRALIQGAEVRVTAEQSSDGEWSASEIEILQVSPGRQLRSKVAQRRRQLRCNGPRRMDLITKINPHSLKSSV